MEAEHNYDEANHSVIESRHQQRDRQQQGISHNNSGITSAENPKTTGRFRSIQTSGNNGNGHMKAQPAAMMHNVNFNLIN